MIVFLWKWSLNIICMSVEQCVSCVVYKGVNVTITEEEE